MLQIFFLRAKLEEQREEGETASGAKLQELLTVTGLPPTQFFTLGRMQFGEIGFDVKEWVYLPTIIHVGEI